MADESKNEEKKENGKEKPEPKDNLVETNHVVTINGRKVNYTVTTGTIVLKEETEKDGKAEGHKPKAEIFFIAYTRDGIKNQKKRPLTFSFNGGPGSSSVWLHLGVLGPRRIVTDDVGNLLQPPYELIENEFSILDKTDLVFIDPVSTGYSRAVEGEKPRDFHGFKKDIEYVGDFIRLYCSRYGRWTSPKFLAGESYGTTRAAGLSGYLQERHGMYLNGIMLISVVLNFQTIRFPVGNDLPYILYLPTMTATAWYHNKLDAKLQASLEDTIEEVRQFAMKEYTLALMQGAALPEKEKVKIERKLARYLGISLDYVKRSNLRVQYFRFCKELLRDQHRTVGRLDSRFLGIDRDAAGEYFEYDPSYAVIQGPYTATFNDYVRQELKFESDLPYEILTGKVWPWNYEPHMNEFANVAETLRKAMTINPYLKVYVANGYYDLATPFLATEYTMNHLDIDATLMDNISMHYYEAGHMMYAHLPSLMQMKLDMDSFLDTAVPA
ncbi:S10 family peptidase [Candidatus Leptofilum sp.]|uniref:S10 family peptidase n=1 Tax=Candidatus Leptofilum sp. TaxID=3241576 RepID=UPI003B5A4E85